MSCSCSPELGPWPWSFRGTASPCKHRPPASHPDIPTGTQFGSTNFYSNDIVRATGHTWRRQPRQAGWRGCAREEVRREVKDRSRVSRRAKVTLAGSFQERGNRRSTGCGCNTPRLCGAQQACEVLNKCATEEKKLLIVFHNATITLQKGANFSFTQVHTFCHVSFSRCSIPWNHLHTFCQKVS